MYKFSLDAPIDRSTSKLIYHTSFFSIPLHEYITNFFSSHYGDEI